MLVCKAFLSHGVCVAEPSQAASAPEPPEIAFHEASLCQTGRQRLLPHHGWQHHDFLAAENSLTRGQPAGRRRRQPVGSVAAGLEG